MRLRATGGVREGYKGRVRGEGKGMGEGCKGRVRG